MTGLERALALITEIEKIVDRGSTVPSFIEDDLQEIRELVEDY
jgi:hypothetical protein